MGMITNQWLNRGQNLRSRTYQPISAQIYTQEETTSWGNANRIAIRIRAWNKYKENQYQEMYLDVSEVDQAVACMLKTCSPEKRPRIVGSFLNKLPDSELAQVLAGVNGVVVRMLKACGAEKRRQIVQELLKELPDSELLQVLADDLPLRVRAKGKKAAS